MPHLRLLLERLYEWRVQVLVFRFKFVQELCKLIKHEISHEDFMTIINEEKKYRELKESIRMMNSQRSDTEKNDLIEEGRK